MSTEIATGRGGYQVALPPNHELTKTIVQARSFLPLLRLMTGSSTPVKKKKIEIDHFALTLGDKLEDLGTQVKAICFTYRHAASILTPDPKTGKNKMYCNYDLPSDKFKEIQAKSEGKTKEDGHFWGFDFLAWLPDQRKFCIIPLNNPTNRNAQPDFEARLGSVIIIGSEPVSNSKHEWTGITCQSYSGIIDPENEPAASEVAAQIAKFQVSGEMTSEAAGDQPGVTTDPNAQKVTRG